MSMTTDLIATHAEPPSRSWSRTLGIGGLAVFCWIAILVGVTVVAEPHPDVLVLGPPHHTLSLLRDTDIRVTDLQETHAVLHGTGRGFVRTLYARGAFLVLPARAPGCMPFPRERLAAR